MKIKEKNGITLVALVITIIILLILAGISIAALTGDNGLFSKAGEAKNATENAEIKKSIEQEIVQSLDKKGKINPEKLVERIQKNVNQVTSVTASENNKMPITVTFSNGTVYVILNEENIYQAIKVGEKASSNSNAVYKSGNYVAVIPAGFTVSNIAGETSIETGLVIRDDMVMNLYGYR